MPGGMGDAQDMAALSQVEGGGSSSRYREAEEAKGSASSSASAAAAAANRSNPDKIRCLDGLRGIACLLVFNYHFLWPWTGSIMMGYGALPPRTPQPTLSWHQLPIICLLHRGRAMVAIFFAISGYVVCRHIIRAIHERRVQDAYSKLASAVFRRAFRLYIPPTISMLLVAILAQVGVFKSEFDVYKGPDSVYINGTTSVGKMPYGSDHHYCQKGLTPVNGLVGIAKYMHLDSPDYLNITLPVTRPTVCMNHTSKLVGPDKVYKYYEDWLTLWEAEPNTTTNYTLSSRTSSSSSQTTSKASSGQMYKSLKALKAERFKTRPKGPDMKWVQFGGSWEEHPLIHDNITYAAKNFTRVYAEWANPFNFGHYHPRYDPHTFTIPKELRGSIVCYVFLLATAAMKVTWRFRIGAGLAVYSWLMGNWDMGVFLGGALLSERDIREADGRFGRGNGLMGSKYQLSPQTSVTVRRLSLIVALYFLSYPDVAAEWTPGFVWLSYFIPKYYYPMSGWMFYQGLGALILVNAILQGTVIKKMLEGRFAQWMGKLSFSFYLIHGPVLHSLGFWIMPRLFESLGMAWGMATGYVILLGTSLYLSAWWYEKVDVWSMGVGRRVEAMAIDRS